MKNTYKYPKFWVAFPMFFLVIIGCNSLLNYPSHSEKSTLGETTNFTSKIKNLPLPTDKVVVGVYKFRDQTGQYKAAENGASWSTAIPQGTTTILIKALEDSRWFRPIERENIGNLLNERQIIRSTRKEYMPNQINESGNLPPLLYAGIILEGGVISYDTNVVTGGLGARYFGIGASTNYRQDRITVYLRAVSTQTGEILKTVYTSKTILSTAISGSFFRYVDTEKLMEAEVGITQNEPVHLAVTEAIEKAVYGLIVEGVKDNIWGSKVENPTQFTKIIEDYNAEKSDNDLNVLGKKIADNQRAKFSMYGMAEATQIRGDFVNPEMHPGAKGGMKYFFSDHFNIDGNASYFIFENKKLFWRRAISADVNIEYLLLPKSKFTPYVYGGVGSVFYRDKNFFKSQVGGGLEYLVNRTFALRLNTQYDLGFNDDWDFKVQGTRKDQSVRIGLGINVYLNRKTAQPLKTTNP